MANAIPTSETMIGKSTKQWLGWCGLLALAALIVVAVVRHRHVQNQNAFLIYERIEIGMPYEEVEKQLGKPSGDISFGGKSHCAWRKGDYVISVSVDLVLFHPNAGCVTEKGISEAEDESVQQWIGSLFD
jgi:hypothetical protein